jgi:predicted dehydrogenase
MEFTMPPQNRNLRVGVIGAGWPGERHAEGFLATGEATIDAIADLEEPRRQAFAARYGATRQFADYRDLLADPDLDAVVIALPNFLHLSSTLAALESGKHVLCEKPPAMTTAEAEQMAKTADRHGLVLGYATRRRFNPATDLLAARIAQGRLGEVYHARAVWTRTWGVPIGVGGWFTDPARAGGGALIDIGIHVLDLAWFLMGHPDPVTVSGSVFNKYPNLTRTDDSAFAFVRFADGRSLHVETSWVLAQGEDTMEVHLYGTEGGARLDDNSLDIYGVGEEGVTRTTPRVTPGLYPSFVSQALDFIHAVREGSKTRTSARQGLLLMAMLEGIYRSAQEGREIEVRELRNP